MRIDLLYFDGCPSWQEALKNMQAALAAEGLQAELHLIRVDGDVEAARMKFLGSPSFFASMGLRPVDRATRSL